MNEFKVGDFIVWLDHGYDGIYEIEAILKTRIYVYDIVKGERKGHTLFNNLKRKYRHATSKEIKQGFRDE